MQPPRHNHQVGQSVKKVPVFLHFFRDGACAGSRSRPRPLRAGLLEDGACAGPHLRPRPLRADLVHPGTDRRSEALTAPATSCALPEPPHVRRTWDQRREANNPPRRSCPHAKHADQQREAQNDHCLMRAFKPIELLVPVSSTLCSASTPGLSTWWSSTALEGVLVLRWVSRLDAFSGYPVRT